MENEKTSLTKKNTAEKTFSFTKKQLFITTAVIISLFIILWVWKAIQIGKIKDSYIKREETLKQKMSDWSAETHLAYLKLLAKPYVWAARKELLQKNLAQINLYGNDIVKEKNFEFVIIADQQGKIITSTDKKFENKNISTVASPEYLKPDTTMVKKLNDSVMLVVSPIMEFNSKLGTLFIKYNTKKPAFIKPAE